MARLKLTKEQFNVKELDVDWDDQDYPQYDGEQPPANTVLVGRVQKVWYTTSSNDNAMFKLIFVADDNEGKRAQYNGLPIWDNITFVDSAAFRYGPFLEIMGLTLNDIFTKTDVDPEDSQGDPINSIAGWEPDSDDAWCRVVTKRERYEGNWGTKVARYLPLSDDDDDDDEPEPEPEPEPRTRARKPAAARPATRKGTSRRKAEPEPEDEPEEDDYEDEPEEDDEPEEAAPKSSARSRRSAPSGRSTARAKTPAKSTRTSRGGTTKAATGRRRAKGGDADNEPPF